MGDFERSYDKMKKAYDKKKYEKALQLLSRMWEENGIKRLVDTTIQQQLII